VTKRYSAILADPPWKFGDKLPGKGRGAPKHYQCLSLAELCLFPLPPIHDDAWLFLWRCGSMQLEALAVARAWGFGAPVSEFVWEKVTKDGTPRMGMGRTVRNSHEVCLIFRRGKPQRQSASVVSVVRAPRGRHSEKPEEIARRIERLTKGPYCELFARRVRAGWDCFGHEVTAADAAE
jgi:N6-adenosine-specific RNA methylase IME4